MNSKNIKFTDVEYQNKAQDGAALSDIILREVIISNEEIKEETLVPMIEYMKYHFNGAAHIYRFDKNHVEAKILMRTHSNATHPNLKTFNLILTPDNNSYVVISDVENRSLGINKQELDQAVPANLTGLKDFFGNAS